MQITNSDESVIFILLDVVQEFWSRHLESLRLCGDHVLPGEQQAGHRDRAAGILLQSSVMSVQLCSTYFSLWRDRNL